MGCFSPKHFHSLDNWNHWGNYVYDIWQCLVNFKHLVCAFFFFSWCYLSTCNKLTAFFIIFFLITGLDKMREMILHAAQLVRMAIIMNTKSAWDQYFVYLCFVITELKMNQIFLGRSDYHFPFIWQQCILF